MFARLKFWLRFRRYADFKCRSYCLFCEHFPVCSETLYAYWATLPWKM